MSVHHFGLKCNFSNNVDGLSDLAGKSDDHTADVVLTLHVLSLWHPGSTFSSVLAW